MPNDHNADESSATDDSTDSINRRRFVKGVGATGFASALPIGTGVASAQQPGHEDGVRITGTAGMSPDAVKEDVQAIIGHDGAKALASRIEGETGFEMDDEFAVGIDLETDDEELNAHDPRLMHLPMMPSGVGDVPSMEPRRDRVPSQSEFSIDNGGVLMALTVRAEGERKLATLMGITREKSRSSSLLTSTTEKVDTKSFVVENGSAKKHRERTGQQPLKSDWQAEIGMDTSTVKPMGNGGFTCWGCATVVGIACGGAAYLSYSTCVSAAFASSVFSPYAGAAVAAFCTYIVTNANTLSCAAGVAAICAGVTNDCQFLEN